MGENQKSVLYASTEDNIKIKLNGLIGSTILQYQRDDQGPDSFFGNFQLLASSVYTNHYMYILRTSTYNSNPDELRIGRGNILAYSSDITGTGFEFPLEINTPDQETRPENIAVRYFVRALP